MSDRGAMEGKAVEDGGASKETRQKVNMTAKVSVGRPVPAGAQGLRLGHQSGLGSSSATLLSTQATSSATVLVYRVLPGASSQHQPSPPKTALPKLSSDRPGLHDPRKYSAPPVSPTP